MSLNGHGGYTQARWVPALPHSRWWWLDWLWFQQGQGGKLWVDPSDLAKRSLPSDHRLAFRYSPRKMLLDGKILGFELVIIHLRSCSLLPGLLGADGGESSRCGEALWNRERLPNSEMQMMLSIFYCAGWTCH